MKYKIALIGCGRISFKHIEAFVAMQDKADLVAVCDPVVDRAEEKKALEIILAIYKSQKIGIPVALPCDFSTLEMKGIFN